ncbi:hypothetical protein [Cytobacillus sp. NCCP-133]|uniref:hypothetical protein n=1 Tax=Cytobacillus sp. NCCP-133 TaxID=766848 RepID=UPI0022319C38|nr:hypothetical protein [Cytobacillus sp. NCCP-133]GLB61324.1 hypothetical protein NCCP133_34540 [Cytobacillus sp. NCCP-133]
MSDFIKSVVQEVMKPYQKPKSNPITAKPPQTQRREYLPLKEMTVKEKIPGINRPNYQRANMDKRLSASVSAANIDKRTQQTKPVIGHKSYEGSGFQAKVNAKETLSKLQTISLVQGKRPAGTNPSFLSKESRKAGESKLIGQTGDGIKAWLFQDLAHSLQNAFQRSLKSASIGVITSERCTVSQLFYLNDILRENPSLKYCLTWDKESRQSFILELYEENEQNLLNAVKNFYKQASQRTYHPVQTQVTKSPSAWLTKQLDIKASVSGAAVLEGIDYYTGILLADRYLKRNPIPSAGFSFEKNYLLIHGEYDSVLKVSEDLKKEAQRIN